MNLLEEKKRSDNVADVGDGQIDVTISYDITDQGHDLGVARNYDVAKVTKLINNKNLQEQIKQGMYKGAYGHDVRGVSGFIKERHEDGKVIVPITVTRSLSIDGNIITHVQRMNNASKEGRIAQKLVKQGAAAFSVVWNVDAGKFYGYDVVTTPNFLQNRLIVDSLTNIKDGVIDYAAIARGLSDLFEVDYSVDDIQRAIEDNPIMDGISSLLEYTCGLKEKINTLQEEIKSYEHDKIERVKEYKDALTATDSLTDKVKEAEEKTVNVEKLHNKLVNGIKKEGYIVDTDGVLHLKNNPIDRLFSKGDVEKASKVSYDDINLKLGIEKKEEDPSLSFTEKILSIRR